MTKRSKASKPEDVNEDEDELEDGFDDADAEDPDEGPALANTSLVSKFIRMWPREIFNVRAGDGQRGFLARSISELEKPGVYVLYRDDVPFYVGKTTGKLRSRLRTHATGVVSLKSYFWNYFSAFIVTNKSHIDEVEAILISAMPSVISNSSTPRLKKVPMGVPVRKLMRELRSRR
jgi:predicted GIY-YIG superfamily endonuclease